MRNMRINGVLSNTKSDEYRRMWERRRADAEDRISKGLCTLRNVEGRVQVVAPDHSVFKVRAPEIEGGRYLERSKSWSFRAEDLDEVLALCKLCFGKDRVVHYSGATFLHRSGSLILSSGVIVYRERKGGMDTGAVVIRVSLPANKVVSVVLNSDDRKILREVLL